MNQTNDYTFTIAEWVWRSPIGRDFTQRGARMADAEAVRKQRQKQLDDKRRRLDELRQRKKVVEMFLYKLKSKTCLP